MKSEQARRRQQMVTGKIGNNRAGRINRKYGERK